MRVLLIARDQRLYQCCRKVFVELNQVNWNLSVVDSNPSLDGDLYIWDYESDPSLGGEEHIPDFRKIFIVNRKDVVSLRERLDGRPVRVVLKPVSRILLRTVISEVVSTAALKGPQRSEGRLALIQRDREEMLQYLLECNLHIQEYDQARSTFLAHGVHDLRGPLTAILGYTKLLLDQQLGPLGAEQIKVIERMYQSARRIRRLANSMLQASVGGQPLFRPRVIAGDMAETVARAVSEITPLADARNVKVQAKIAHTMGPLVFDPALIVQVLLNLLDNGCRFTPKGGLITIRGFPVFWDRRALNLAEAGPHIERRRKQIEQPNAYRVEVRDNGPGIKPADRERVFDEYTSMDSQPDGDTTSHFGLGLATCRQIIDLHQGHIFVEPGEGACIVFILPFVREETKGIQEPQNSIDRATVAGVLQ